MGHDVPSLIRLPAARKRGWAISLQYQQTLVVVTHC
jgi:hypothetical protein